MQQGISQKKTARLKGAQDFFLRNSVAFLDVSVPNIKGLFRKKRENTP